MVAFRFRLFRRRLMLIILVLTATLIFILEIIKLNQNATRHLEGHDSPFPRVSAAQRKKSLYLLRYAHARSRTRQRKKAILKQKHHFLPMRRPIQEHTLVLAQNIYEHTHTDNIATTSMQQLRQEHGLTPNTARSRDTQDSITMSTTQKPAPCKPINHIVFIKTQKTGGSTVTNILNRYGHKRGLTFALPARYSSFGWPNLFKTTAMEPLGDQRPNILCNHARYNKRPMNLLFPRPQTKYVTIIRYPVSHYESVFTFFKMDKVLPIKGNSTIEVLDKFLAQKRQFEDLKSVIRSGLAAAHLLRNPILFDLGFEYRYFQNSTAIINFIKFLHNELDLVLIVEYFDESMVLLKRVLCWDLEDVLYIKLNERRDKDKSRTSERIRQNILSWNKADMLLYESFNKTFWEKIQAEGPGFYDDLEELRKRKKSLNVKCIKTVKVVNQPYRDFFIKVKNYILKDLQGTDKTFCEDSIRHEMDYINLHKKRQRMQIAQINRGVEFENLYDSRNNWDVSQDLAHEP